MRGLGIEAVLDRVWCFCVIFKFIFRVFWIIIMEKDGWPDWLTYLFIYLLISGVLVTFLCDLREGLRLCVDV